MPFNFETNGECLYCCPYVALVHYIQPRMSKLVLCGSNQGGWSILGYDYCATKLIEIVDTCLTPGDYPLWIAQTQFINCWYASWAGDMKLLEWALERRASLATVNPLAL